MARGGKREGKPGTAYANRTDLNAPKPPVMQLTGQEYGQRTAQVAQQQASRAAVPQQQDWAPPPAPVGLFGPSIRPDEPVTHGLPTGPGGGPEILDLGTDDDDVLVALRAAYDAFPSSDLLRLIFDEEGRRGGL